MRDHHSPDVPGGGLPPASFSPAVPISGLSSSTVAAALEKVPSAARRMGLSVSQFYRIAKRDGLRIIKVGERASAVISAEVDGWVQARIAETSRTVQTSAREVQS